LERWAAFARLFDDGRICRSNAAAERAVRGVVIGRGSWTFAGSDAGRQGAAVGPHADRDLRIKRHRSTGLARPNSREATGSSREAARQMAAMELDAAPTGNRGSG
jgi:Transposase IS66 family